MQVTFKTEKIKTKAVYFTGTDTLKAGYALCYDRADIAALGGDAVAIPLTTSSWGRHTFVVKPASGNLHNFAGIVSQQPDKTGPTWVKIIEPEGMPRSMQLFTDQNCTANTTFLTIVAGSFVIGGIGDGIIIAKALQTKDRSSTSGLVQGLVRFIDPFSKIYGDAVPSSTNNVPSAIIWESCPWKEFVDNPTLGYAYFNDYLEAVQTVDNDAFAITTTTSGVLTNTTGAGGILLVDSGGNATADDGMEAQLLVSPWLPATDKELWFEARIALSANDPDQYFIGLAAIDTTLMAAGVIDDVVDKIGFFNHAASTADRLSFITADGATEAIDTDEATTVDDTYINLGFKATPTLVTPYINGVAGTAHSTAASIPDGTALALSYVAKVEGADEDAEMSVDWVRIAQIR